MRLTFKEACESVADLFEAMPKFRTKRSFARMKNGNPCFILDPKAEQWCTQGGILAAMKHRHLPQRYENTLDDLSSKMFGFSSFMGLNDSRIKKINTHKAVIAVLHAAAK